jgi:hypothetical protein
MLIASDTMDARTPWGHIHASNMGQHDNRLPLVSLPICSA